MLKRNALYRRKEKTMIQFEDNKQLVNYIKMAIKNRGLTVEDVAKKMGISGQNLHSIFNKKNLSFIDVKRICDAINCELHCNIERKEKIEYIEKQMEYLRAHYERLQDTNTTNAPDKVEKDKE